MSCYTVNIHKANFSLLRTKSDIPSDVGHGCWIWIDALSKQFIKSGSIPLKDNLLFFWALERRGKGKGFHLYHGDTERAKLPPPPMAVPTGENCTGIQLDAPPSPLWWKLPGFIYRQCSTSFGCYQFLEGAILFSSPRGFTVTTIFFPGVPAEWNWTFSPLSS